MSSKKKKSLSTSISTKILKWIYLKSGIGYIIEMWTKKERFETRPSNLIPWLIAVYSAVYGIAFQIHENELMRKHSVVGIYAEQIDSPMSESAFDRLLNIQEEEISYEPNWRNPISIVRSFYRKERSTEIADIVDRISVNYFEMNVEKGDWDIWNIRSAMKTNYPLGIKSINKYKSIFAHESTFNEIVQVENSNFNLWCDYANRIRVINSNFGFDGRLDSIFAQSSLLILTHERVEFVKLWNSSISFNNHPEKYPEVGKMIILKGLIKDEKIRVDSIHAFQSLFSGVDFLTESIGLKEKEVYLYDCSIKGKKIDNNIATHDKERIESAFDLQAKFLLRGEYSKIDSMREVISNIFDQLKAD